MKTMDNDDNDNEDDETINTLQSNNNMKSKHKKDKDPFEISFGGEIILNFVNIILLQNNNNNKYGHEQKLFTISINSLIININSRLYDNNLILSIDGLTIYDNIPSHNSFHKIITSEDPW